MHPEEMKVIVILMLGLFSYSVVSASLTTSSTQEFGRSESCSGEMVVFTCNISSLSHVLRVQTNSMTLDETLSAATPNRIRFGFTFAVSQFIPGDRIVTTVTVESSPALDGVVITCIDALVAPPDPDPPSITARVVDLSVTLPPPTVLSPSIVRVSPVLQNTPTVGQPCAGVYRVEVSTGGSVVRSVTNSTANLVIPDLDLCRDTYSFVTFFESNSVSIRSQLVSLVVTPSDLGLGSVSEVVQVVSDGSAVLVWNSPDTSTLCVEGYTLTVSHPNGTQSQFTTSNTSFPISRLGLTECVSVTVRVSPRVPVFPAPLDSLSGTGTAANFLHNFTFPQVETSFCFDSAGNQRLAVILLWQDKASMYAVDTILVGHSTIEGGCSASVMANSRQRHTFNVTTGLAVEVCVSIQTGTDCWSNITVPVPDPSPLFVDVTTSCPPNLFVVTLTLNFSLLCDSLDQYRVQAFRENISFQNDATIKYVAQETFHDSSREFSGRISSISGKSILESTPISYTPVNCGNPNDVIIAVVLTFLLTLVLGVSIGVLTVLGYQKCRRSGQSSKTETEMKIRAVTVYEDPDTICIKSEPQTQSNLAYGHVQFT